jgi:Zn ribbon nucleic-acid-binding protein
MAVTSERLQAKAPVEGEEVRQQEPIVLGRVCRNAARIALLADRRLSAARCAMMPVPTHLVERDMKLECPKCDSNVVQILWGIDDSRYTMCVGCGELTHFKRKRIASEKIPTPDSLGRDTAHSQSDHDNPPKVMWRPVD